MSLIFLMATPKLLNWHLYIEPVSKRPLPHRGSMLRKYNAFLIIYVAWRPLRGPLAQYPIVLVQPRTATHLKISRHYCDVKITVVSNVYSTFCSGADPRNIRAPGHWLFVKGIHRWPVDSPHKGLITRKMFPFWWRHHDRALINKSISNSGLTKW